ncbi:glucan biosynthesis protein G [Marinobacter sp.]|uniref:glucan biosynthesis protein G n=1 Tax=Marinobacter sp. TaxID=50741 RepID=UPI0034A27844
MRSGTRLLTGLLLPWLLNAFQAGAFEFEEVVEKARALANAEYEPPPDVPGFLKDLNYEAHQGIRFNPEASLWRGSGSLFQVMLVPPGNYYSHTVKLNGIDNNGVHAIAFDKSAYSFPSSDFAKRVPADLGHAGFKLTYPLLDANEQNQFLVFAGASYFRGVGAGNRFGLSARGIALNTGLPSGEEFPSFVEFWLERPGVGGNRMRVYGLLSGPSVAGAYRFDIQPGAITRMDVTAELFFRNGMKQPGFAPLTSMFYYGENTVRPIGEWRPQVHDSDGLLIHDQGTGEWLWRPLLNPSRLSLSYLQVKQLGGFGLIQRNTEFHQFEDAEARYDLRPSAWVSMRQRWSDGEVVLVEIPTDSETNDNIVAFWKPREETSGGEQRSLAYALSFGGPDVADQDIGRVVHTFIGDGNRPGGGNAENAYRIIVDFAGGPLASIEPNAPVVSHVSKGGYSGGDSQGKGDDAEIIEHFVEFVEADNHWRLSMLVRPGSGGNPVFHGQLLLGDKPLTEVWSYPFSQAARAALNGS